MTDTCKRQNRALGQSAQGALVGCGRRHQERILSGVIGEKLHMCRKVGALRAERRSRGFTYSTEEQWEPGPEPASADLQNQWASSRDLWQKIKSVLLKNVPGEAKGY